MAKKIAILCTNGYEDLEMHYPRIRLIEAGYDVEVVALDSKIIRGKNGYPYKPDSAIQEVKADDFDGLILPGGAKNPDYLRRSEEVLNFVSNFDKQKKLIAAICHAGWVLISSKIIKGRNATSYFSIKDDMINAGVNFKDQKVVIDNNLITSRKPSDLPAFMKAILNYLDEQ